MVDWSSSSQSPTGPRSILVRGSGFLEYQHQLATPVPTITTYISHSTISSDLYLYKVDDSVTQYDDVLYSRISLSQGSRCLMLLGIIIWIYEINSQPREDRNLIRILN